jgi:glycosyltransferase involved in cell wall biosynthesis
MSRSQRRSPPFTGPARNASGTILQGFLRVTRLEVSIVIPTRNRSTLLALTLRSVLCQRNVDLEVVIVDEASTDDTPALLASVRDPRVRVIRHDTPRGVSTARNRGAAAAHADWIAFLDDDDLWAPNKLALQLEAARASGALWAYVGHININMHDVVTGGAPPLCPGALVEELPRHNVVPGGCSGVMVSRKGLAIAGMFDERLQALADWDLWLRLSHVGTPACVPQPLVAYRVHGQQMSLDTSRVEDDFRILSDRNPAASPAILYRYLGWWALRVKNHRGALQLFVRGWRQRRSDYSTAMLAADIASLCRDILEHRLHMRWPIVHSSAQLSEEHRAWRREGQAWIDRLVDGESVDSRGSE